MILRKWLFEEIDRQFQIFPIVMLLGPRQCGKTTLATAYREAHPSTFFDLEDPSCELQADNAKLVLEKKRDLIIIDEFQKQPSLFELLRVLVDRPNHPARFLILGSASPDLVKGASESLAGRVGMIEMSGFHLLEVNASSGEKLWVRGGFPLSYLASDGEKSVLWRENFIRTFLERDIPQLGIRVPAEALRRFWTMVAHYHGQVWNASEIGRSLGVRYHAVQHYLDILSGSFMVRVLPAWYENVGKRLVKSPKVYLTDSGILHRLLRLDHLSELRSHPKLGASWEGFALEQLIRIGQFHRDCYYYRTHSGAELDLLLLKGGKRYGFEFKYADAPKTTKSMHHVIEDLNLEKLIILYPGQKAYPLEERIAVHPLVDFVQNLDSHFE